VRSALGVWARVRLVRGQIGGHSGRRWDAGGIDLWHNRDMGSRLGARAGHQLQEFFSDVEDSLETPPPGQLAPHR
jgi:hypothetical protein